MSAIPPAQRALLPETNRAALARFEVRDPREAARLLDDLARACTSITLHAPADHETFVVSRLLGRDARGLRLEVDEDDQRRATLLEAGAAVAVGFLDGVKVQFEARVLTLAHPASASELRCAPPGRVHRLQRREAFRVRPDQRLAATCVLRCARGERACRVLDVSAGGVALALPAGETAPAIGSSWQHCRLEIAGYPPIPCELQVRFVADGLPDGSAGTRVGCVLVRPTPEAGRAVQVVVMDVERGRSPPGATPACS